MNRLRRLQSGDRVALVAPASSFPHEELAAGVAELARLGFEAVYDERIFDKDRFVAGSVETRVRAIHDAWADPSIAALIAMRGGYGSAQLLPFLDPDLLRSRPQGVDRLQRHHGAADPVSAQWPDRDPRADDRSPDLERRVRVRRGFISQGADAGRTGRRAATGAARGAASWHGGRDARRRHADPADGVDGHAVGVRSARRRASCSSRTSASVRIASIGC